MLLPIIWVAILWHFAKGQSTDVIWEGNKTAQLAIGGKEVALGELPYSVVVLAKSGKCTGSIIHSEWILTAAHCVCDHRGKSLKHSDIEVLAGIIDYKFPGSTAQKREGLKIIMYPDYRHGELGIFDIALIKVAPFQLNNYVSIIKFSGKGWPQDQRMLNRSCTSAGWGMLAGRTSTSVLHKQKTIAKHGKDSCPCTHKSYIWKRIVCLVPESAVSICFGDSGGALVCDGEIAGVAHMVMDKRSCSYFKSPDSTIYCESSHVFGIYMYTCPYLNWIKQYVPDIPPTPASCKGVIGRNVSMASLMFLIVFNLLVIKN